MFTNDLVVDESKLRLITKIQTHIEKVFGVSLFISSRSNEDENGSTCSEEGEASMLRISSQCSQKSIEKAKNYILALTEESENFHRTVEELSEEQFNMVLENQSDIENESQAVLQFFENLNRICISGAFKNVKVAQSLIQKMRGDFNEDDLFSRCQEETYKDCTTYGGHNLTSFISHKNIMATDASQMKSNSMRLLTQRQESLQTDGAPFSCYSDNEMFSNCDVSNLSQICLGEDISSCPGYEGDVVVSPDDSCSDNFSFTGYDSTAQTSSSQTKSSCIVSSQSNSDDENDEEVNQIIQDTKYRAKIEFALKLGYSQSQIAAVLKKFGPNVGQNEMLSELIKIDMMCSNLNQNNDSESEECTFSTEGSISYSSFSDEEGLRPIVIDGSNVAMSHGNKDIFSCRGIQLAVDWFRQRGHTQITVFVPQWRKETSRPDARITDQEILNQLEKEKVLVFTPARRIAGKRVVCYDDRYVLTLASENDGIVVSNDNYRDLINEKPEYKKVVEERLLMFSFVNDRFMPPEDPLGRHGPSLDNFLKHQHAIAQEALPPLCPYGSKKCTYGNKCKYYHPERGNIPQKTVSDKLAEQAKQKLKEVRAKAAEGADKKKLGQRKPKMALQRTKSLATELPANLVCDKLDNDFNKLNIEDILSKDTEKDEKWKQYDDKLSEKRKLLEKAEQDEKLKQEELRKRADFEHLKTLQGGSRSNTPSPSHRLSPSPIRPQEQFLSGHLLLAKKLSDEANDSKLRRSEEHAYTKSPLAATQSYPVISVPDQEISQQQPQHKKLSRQYSLQGAHDPRLKPSVRPQVSFDPNMIYGQRSGFTQDPLRPSHPSSMMQKQHDNSAFYRNEASHSASYLSEGYNHKFRQDNEGSFLSPDSCVSHHMALTRMQSAPEVPHHLREQTQPAGRPIGKMMRQNSSSDTQLHIMGGEHEQYGFGAFPQASVERYTTRQDSVTYHIGSQNQQEQFRRSSSTIGQYHYQSGQGFPQHSSHGNPWGMPDQSMHPGFGLGPASDMSEHQPLFNRGMSHDFNTLRARGQMWPNQQSLQQPPYSVASDFNNDAYRQPVYQPPMSDYQHVQSSVGSEGYCAQSRPIGVPILGAHSSSSQSLNQQLIQPSDTRQKLYYHLCGLFPEEKVRAVMNQYPELNNAQEICAMIIGAKF